MKPKTKEGRDVLRKLKVLRHAENSAQVPKPSDCVASRSSLFRWNGACEQRGEAGLVDAMATRQNPAKIVKKFPEAFTA